MEFQTAISVLYFPRQPTELNDTFLPRAVNEQPWNLGLDFQSRL